MENLTYKEADEVHLFLHANPQVTTLDKGSDAKFELAIKKLFDNGILTFYQT